MEDIKSIFTDLIKDNCVVQCVQNILNEAVINLHKGGAIYD